jgi:nitrogen-specific signal transduction histidine kinase
MNVTTRKIGEHAAITLSYRVPFISDDDIKDFFYPFAVAYPFAKGTTNGDIMDVPIAKVVIHNHGGIINVGKEDDNLVWIDISLPLKHEASAL